MIWKVNIMREIIDTAKDLIRFNTIVDNDDEFARCSKYIQEFFNGKGDVREFEKEGVISLLVTRDGNLEPDVLIACHMDVVPGSKSMFEPRLEDGKLFGRGAYDDKGPLALAMHLVREMISEGNDAALLVTGDEEKGGFRGARHVMEQGLKPKFAIAIDGGGPNRYVVKSKGILQLRLTAHGSEAHGSRPWEGDNAIESLMEDLQKIKEMFPWSDDEKHWHTTANIGKIGGGDAVNKVPGKAEAWIDIRYIEDDDPDTLVEKIGGAIKSDLEVLMKEPCFLTDKDDESIKQLVAISEEVYGEEPEITVAHGGSDARHLVGIPTVITNLAGEGMHADNECLHTDSIENLYNTLRKFIEERRS